MKAVLAVYTGTDLLTLSLIRSDNDADGDGVASASFPAVAGSSYLVAVDTVGAVTGNISLNWRLGNRPLIMQGPANQTGSQGGSVRFSVVALGTPAPTYQWQFNGVDLATVEGRTEVTVSISSTARFYRLRQK